MDVWIVPKAMNYSELVAMVNILQTWITLLTAPLYLLDILQLIFVYIGYYLSMILTSVAHLLTWINFNQHASVIASIIKCAMKLLVHS